MLQARANEQEAVLRLSLGDLRTPADLLYGYMFAYRWAHRGDDEAHYDPAIDRATAALRQRLAAVRIVGTDTASKSFRIGDVEFVRELLLVEVEGYVAPGTSVADADAIGRAVDDAVSAAVPEARAVTWSARAAP